MVPARLRHRGDRRRDVLIPIIVFAFLYGLSIDYQVFILSRVREEYDARASTDQRSSAASAGPVDSSPVLR